MRLSTMVSRTSWMDAHRKELSQGCDWALVNAAVKGIHGHSLVLPS